MQILIRLNFLIVTFKNKIYNQTLIIELSKLFKIKIIYFVFI